MALNLEGCSQTSDFWRKNCKFLYENPHYDALSGFPTWTGVKKLNWYGIILIRLNPLRLEISPSTFCEDFS